MCIVEKMQHLYDFFLHMSEFVNNVCISRVGKRGLHISFQFLSYDLIDQELDYNEKYYEDMRANVVALLLHECKTLLDQFQEIEVFQAITLMQKWSKMEQHFCITNETTVLTKYNK
jgi:hypothetical protein